MSISSNDDSDSTEESDCKYNSEHHSDEDMCMEDDVDALCSIVLDRDVDIERDSDNAEEEDQEEEEEEEEEDDDDGKEPRMIGQGVMVNTLADDLDNMVEDKAIVLPEQCQEMQEYTPRPKPQATAPRPQILGPHPRPRTLATHPLGGLEFLLIVTLLKARREVPTLRKAEAARNTSDVEVDQQLLGLSAGCERVPYVTLTNVPHPGTSPDGSVRKEGISPHVPEEEIFVAFRSGTGSCLVCFLCFNLFISGIDYYTRREVSESLRVCFISVFCTGLILFIVLGNITHATFLQLRACKEPPCDCVETQ